MSTPLTLHLGRLADRLADLRVRLKEAARHEVAQAVSETFSAWTRTLICDPAAASYRRPRTDNRWDDPWADPYEESTAWNDATRSGNGRLDGVTSRIAAAILTGLGAARCLVRSGQAVVALVVGIFVTLLVLLFGDKVATLLDVCSAAQDLLLFPERKR